MRLRTAIAPLILLAACAGPSSASFVLEVGPSVPASSGSIGLVGGDVVATNLALTSITDGVKSVALGQDLDFQSGPYSDFFVLPGLVQQFGGTPPTAYGIGLPGYSLTSSGGVEHLTITGLRSHLDAALSADFGVPANSVYDGTLRVDYVVNPSLAGGQVIDGSITLTPLSPSVPGPPSLALAAIGLILGTARRLLAG